MNLRIKLFAGIFSFLLIASSLFGFIAYQTAIIGKADREIILLKDFSQQLINDLYVDVGTNINRAVISAWFERYTDPQISLVVYGPENQTIIAETVNTLPSQVLQRIINLSSPYGSISDQQNTYTWFSHPIPNTPYYLALSHNTPNKNFAEQSQVFMTPISIVMAILLIVTLWTSMFVASLIDRLQRQKGALRHQAMHDALTALPNRSLLKDRLQHAIDVAHREKSKVALCLINLNHFKDVNDTLGHHFGDQLLVQISQRLHKTLRKCDTIARLGGDEFALILRGASLASTHPIIEKILKQIEEVVEVEGNKLFISGCIGIAMYPDHGEETNILLKHADIAMYEAKRAGIHITIYDQELDKFSQERLTLIKDLGQAFDTEQLSLHYQPKVNINSLEAIAAEALLRWNHPTLGNIPPDRFISIAEQSGLIRPLTEVVLRMALRDLAALTEQGIDTNIAINLSACNLQDADLENLLINSLHQWKMHPANLTLELTESAMMANPAHAQKLLFRLDSIGFKISIDDFGTGFSSLVNLKRLPVQEIKIDRSFVLNMNTNEEDASIVKATIELGHSLGMNVVAEGVEDQASLDHLQELGCDIAQGYYISRPIPFPQFVNWMKSNQANKAKQIHQKAG